MGQPAELLSFRKRLSNAGYFDIHIKKANDGFWIVSACEPLGGYRITVKAKSFSNYFRKKIHRHGCETVYVYRPESKPIESMEVFTDQRVN